MSTFNERLKELRKASGLTQKQLSQDLELGESTVSMYEQGSREPDFEILNRIVDYFNVDLNYLMGRIDSGEFAPVSRIVRAKKVPVYGRIPAGSPFEAIYNDLGEIDIPGWLAKKDNLFGLVVAGDSMNRIIPDGYIAVLQKTSTLENGEIGALLVNGNDATLKKLIKLTEYVVLEPLSFNPEHKPLLIGKNEPDVQVLGKLVWACAAHEL
ncbi:MAG: XRE family transcriptional regulator [Erysipelotrichaceae bacterium]